MISVVFRKHGDELVGVTVSGHSGYAEAGKDIVCAAVTSAVQLCECTITDVIGVEANVFVNHKLAEININLPDIADNEAARVCQVVLGGLKLHLSVLSEEYPKCITVSEV